MGVIIYDRVLIVFNPLTVGSDYIRGFHILLAHCYYQISNMLKIKRDINQQDLKIVDLHFDLSA